MKHKELHEVISLGMDYCPSITESLFKTFNADDPLWVPGRGVDANAAKQLADQICEAGSHSFTSMFSGNEDYKKVVHNVAKKLGVKAEELDKDGSGLVDYETKLMSKLFSDIWDNLSEQEREDLLSDMDLTGKEIDPSMLAKSGVLATQVLLKQFGGFATYRMAVVMANFLSRQLLGRGLSFAANAAVTRAVGVLIGPVGWIVTAGWLAHDLAGPAYRKVTPAVVYIAAIRSKLETEMGFGVVGLGSSGKDACLKQVFGIEEASSSPLAGSTDSCQAYRLVYERDCTGLVINFPGFNDHDPQVSENAEGYLALCRGFIIVIDATSGLSGSDAETIQKIRERGRPFVVCLNKWDLIRPADREALRAKAVEKLGLSSPEQIITTVFDPDERLEEPVQGVDETIDWILGVLDMEHATTKAFWGSMEPKKVKKDK
ncbi:MAG: hypothetical protein JKY61_12535 [Planctomycetes bacterium]|nr:hypothetical protein [Planctomycetota bacterium]